MNYTVYKTTNKINGKIYIGKHQTDNLDDGYLGSGKHLKRAIKKYGLQNFERVILFNFNNEDDMNSKEAELVNEEFIKMDNNYNLCPGGKGGWGHINYNELNNINHPYKSVKRNNKISVKIKEFVKSNREQFYLIGEIGRKKIKEKYPNGTFFNKTHSDETKLKMSLSSKGTQTGNKNSQFGTMWITNGTENKKIKKEDFIPDGWNRGRKV